MVMGRGLALVGVGLLLGAGAALLLTRMMASLMVGVSATDPLTFATPAALLMAVAAIACLVPAARAVRIDPAIALREE
jgi:putative ABC transport system permease protein